MPPPLIVRVRKGIALEKLIILTTIDVDARQLGLIADDENVCIRVHSANRLYGSVRGGASSDNDVLIVPLLLAHGVPPRKFAPRQGPFRGFARFRQAPAAGMGAARATSPRAKRKRHPGFTTVGYPKSKSWLALEGCSCQRQCRAKRKVLPLLIVAAGPALRGQRAAQERRGCAPHGTPGKEGGKRR